VVTTSAQPPVRARVHRVRSQATIEVFDACLRMIITWRTAFAPSSWL